MSSNMTASIKLSFFQRAKNALKRAARKVASFTKSAARYVAKKTETVWAFARPMLKTFGAVMASVVWTSALMVQPLGTVAITALVGGVLAGFARFMEAHEARPTRFTTAVYWAIEGVAQVLRVAFYMWSALVAVVTLPAWGPVVAVFGIVVLVLHALPTTEAMNEPSFIPSDINVPTVTRRSNIEVVDAILVEEKSMTEKPNAIRAQGAEEMMDVAACDACGLHAHELHESARRPDDKHEAALLCEECDLAEREDDALRFTGVSLAKTSTEVRLNPTGFAATIEHTFSLSDDNVHWLPSAWWRDRLGRGHEREWSALAHGEVIATVVFDYRRGTYRVLVDGKPPRNVGAQRSLAAAKVLATDLWNDAELLRLNTTQQADATDGRALEAM